MFFAKQLWDGHDRVSHSFTRFHSAAVKKGEGLVYTLGSERRVPINGFMVQRAHALLCPALFNTHFNGFRVVGRFKQVGRGRFLRTDVREFYGHLRARLPPRARKPQPRGCAQDLRDACGVCLPRSLCVHRALCLFARAVVGKWADEWAIG